MNSEYFLVEVIVKYGKEYNVEILKFEDFSVVIGKGVEVKINGKIVVLGNFKMMEYVKVDIILKMKDEVKIY